MNDALKHTGLRLSSREDMEPWAARVTQAAVDAAGITQAELAARMGIGETRLSALKDERHQATTAISKLPGMPDASREVVARAVLGERYAVVRLPETTATTSCVLDAHKETSEAVTCALARGLGSAELDREIEEAIVALVRLREANSAARVPANVAAIRRAR